MISLTGTSCVPSGTRIFAIVPSSTASTSIVALSVSISAITSPDWTLSPSFLSHLERLPFSMVGDSAGIRMLIGMSVTLLRPQRGVAGVGWPGDFGFEHLDEALERFFLGKATLARIGARGMTRQVNQKQTPHVRLFERARERDRKPAIDYERAQHLGGIVATDDVWRQRLLLRTSHASPIANGF